MDEFPTETHSSQRHEDLTNIHNAISFGIKVIILAIVPLMLTGVGALVGGWYTQQQLVHEQADLASEFKSLNEKMTTMNQKVEIMWYAGKFSEGGQRQTN